MPIVTCANGHRLSVAEKFAGRKVKCPKCEEIITVPSASLPEVQPTARDIAPETSNAGFDPFGDLPGLQNITAGSPEVYGLGQAEPSSFASSAAFQQQSVPDPRTAPVTRTSISTKQAPASNTRLLIFAGLGFFGVTIPALLIAVLIWLTSSGDQGLALESDNGPRKESEVLRKAIAKYMHAQSEKGGSHWTESEDFYTMPRATGFPNFLMVSDAEQRRLDSNKKSPALQKRGELLRTALKAIGKEHKTGSEGIEDNAVGERAFADILQVMWRVSLMEGGLPDLTPQLCQTIRNVEDKCFGSNSIFSPGTSNGEEQRLDALNKQVELVSLALLNFESTFKKMPTQYGGPVIKGKGLSWRVALLPFLNQQNLYNEFHQDEPWDSPHNIKLVERIPQEFDTEAGSGKSSIHIVVSERGQFSGDTPKNTHGDLRDGISRTLLVLVSGSEVAQEWTKPGGLEFDPNQGMSQFGKPPVSKGYPMSTVDCLKRTIPTNTAAADFAGLVYADDNLPTFEKIGQLFPPGISASPFENLKVDIKSRVEAAEKK